MSLLKNFSLSVFLFVFLFVFHHLQEAGCSAASPSPTPFLMVRLSGWILSAVDEVQQISSSPHLLNLTVPHISSQRYAWARSTATLSLTGSNFLIRFLIISFNLHWVFWKVGGERTTRSSQVIFSLYMAFKFKSSMQKIIFKSPKLWFLIWLLFPLLGWTALFLFFI